MQIKLKKITSLIFAVVFAMSIPFNVFSAGDTLPIRPGEQGASGKNQPSNHGFNSQDILNWSPETYIHSDFMRARVPLQKRINPFAPTQANPNLNPDVQFLNLAADYGLPYMESYQYNDNFANYLMNFWQYTDYYASWHGMTTDEVPLDLYNPEGGWWEREFEFGLLNIPNPAYTNAAHKNGVKSLACIFFPRAEHYSDLIYKDTKGNFPTADKLIEMANYYGFDGYFINAEERVKAQDLPMYAEYVRYLRNNGMYIQVYGSTLYGSGIGESSWGGISYGKDVSYFENWIKSSIDAPQNADSLYINPNPSVANVNSGVTSMTRLGLDPLKTIFNTFEAGASGFKGHYASIYNTFDENLVPKTSIAALGTSAVYTSLDEDLFDGGGTPSYDKNNRGKSEYQKYVIARERTWWSGALRQPFYGPGDVQPAPASLLQEILDVETDPVAAANDPNRGNPARDSWPGAATYITERSVVGNAPFVTNFSTGHGMKYFQNGKVVNANEWSNINIQDILPSWQWWVDYNSTEEKRLKYDFDYDDAFNGGNSLSITGDMTEDTNQTLRLYKTDTVVTNKTQLSLTFKTGKADSNSNMKLALYFKDAPQTPVLVDIEKTTTTAWNTKVLDLAEYKDRVIVAFGLNFDSNNVAQAGYSMKVGEIKITHGENITPAIPTGFKIDKAYDTTEMYVSWDIADYSKVEKYNLYAELSNGNTVFLGGTYDSAYYIKSLYGEKESVKLKLTAVASDGSESDAAVAKYDFSSKVRNIKITEETGYLDVSWDNPETNHAKINLRVEFDYSNKTETFNMTVAKGTTSAEVVVPIADGSRYTLYISTTGNKHKSKAIAYSGRLKDIISKAYNGTATLSGGNLTLTSPSSKDWWHMYIYKAGESIASITRGKHSLNSINVNDTSGAITVVLEDYKGNKSIPVTVPYYSNPDAKFTTSQFPDIVLLEAIQTQVGTTFKDLTDFKGELNLAGQAITDVKGLNLLTNVRKIDLSDTNISVLGEGIFAGAVEKISLNNCKDLEMIDSNTFAGATNLKEVDITGCSNLSVLCVNNSSVEKLTYGNENNFEKLVSIDLSNSKFDMSIGTPEGIFVEKMKVQTAEKSDIITSSTQKTNLALNATIVADQTTSGIWYVNRLFNGKLNDYVNFTSCSTTTPAAVVIDLGVEQIISSWQLDNYRVSSGYGLTDFEILCSDDDGINYNISVAKIENNTKQTIAQDVATPVAARYYKFEVTDKIKYAIVRELQLLGFPRKVYKAGIKYDMQKPAAYLADMPEELEILMVEGELDMTSYLNNYSTVRGTEFTSLKNYSFVDPAYNIETVCDDIRDDVFVKITNKAGKLSMNTINTANADTYIVDYISFRDENYLGETIDTVKVSIIKKQK